MDPDEFEDEPLFLEKDRSRAKRFHHKKRLSKKWRKRLLSRWRPRSQTEEWYSREIGEYVNTSTPCSCEMCCNFRRSKLAKGQSKLTLQELKFFEESAYILKDAV